MENNNATDIHDQLNLRRVKRISSRLWSEFPGLDIETITLTVMGVMETAPEGATVEMITDVAADMLVDA